jgi:hypothetical protein
MELLGDVAQVEAHFNLFVGSANRDAVYVHGLFQTYHRLRKCFEHTRWNSYMMWVMWNLIYVHLEIVLVPVQYRCKIGARFVPNVLEARKLFRIHPMEHLGDVAQQEACFGLFGDSANLDAR